MAIKPEEIKDTSLTDNEITLVDILEKDIDGFLIKNYKGKMLHYILPSKLRNPVIYEIEKKFNEAGWQMFIGRKYFFGLIPANYSISFWTWPPMPKAPNVIDTL